MNHPIHNLFTGLALLGLIALSGCSKDLNDRGVNEAGGSSLVAPVRVSVTDRLRATGDDTAPTPTAALDREKKVKTLHAVAFKANGLFYNIFKCTKVAEGEYTFDMQKEGTFQFVLVANADDALLTELGSKVAVFSELQNVVVKKALGNDHNATDFVLTSDRAEVTTQKGTDATPTPGVLKLRRLAARFDFLNRVSGLKLTKITYGKRMIESHLYSRPTIDGLQFVNDQQVYTAAEGLAPKSAIGMIYGYENPNQNETSFTIEGEYNGKPIVPYVIELKNLTIKRNHLYTIVISSRGGEVPPADPKEGDTAATLRLAIDVIDWETGEEIGMDESMALKAFYVDHEATVSNASFMTPYLKQSPSEIYTVTKGASKVTIAIGTYMEAGSLEIKGDVPAGVSLSKKGAPRTTATGKILQEYELSLPAMNRYADIVATMTNMPFKQEGFMTVTLLAKSSTSDATEEFVVKHGKMKTPLEHLSEYGLAKKNDQGQYTFKETHDNTQQDYFDLLVQLDEIKDLTIGGVRYHLPKDHYEFTSIFPKSAKDASSQIGPTAASKVFEQVGEFILLPRLRFIPTPKGEQPALLYFKADYSTPPGTGKISYALKMKAADGPNGWSGTDGSFLTAYRYEWVGDFKLEDSMEGYANRDKESHLKVTARFLGKGWKGTIKDIANEDFWAKDKSDDVSRRFPMADEYDAYYVDKPGHEYLISRTVGRDGYFATATRYENYWGTLTIDFESAKANHSTFIRPDGDHISFPVRLFTHEL